MFTSSRSTRSAVNAMTIPRSLAKYCGTVHTVLYGLLRRLKHAYHLTVSQLVCLSLRQPIRMSMSVYLSVCPADRPSACLSVPLSVQSTVRLSISMSHFFIIQYKLKNTTDRALKLSRRYQYGLLYIVHSHNDMFVHLLTLILCQKMSSLQTTRNRAFILGIFGNTHLLIQLLTL